MRLVLLLRSVRTGAAAVAVGICLGVTLSACRDNPTGPSPERYRQPRVSLLCQPNGPNVACTAALLDVPFFRDRRDVTQAATWTVDPADVGVFPQPGLLTPARSGEAEIHARSQGLDADFAPRFLVGPGRDARWLHFFSAVVRERDGGAAIGGAHVEMLDGYRRGAACATNPSGMCTIDRILTGETFSARITKSGYQSVTVNYRVDPPVGPAGNPPSMTVMLSRAGAE
jgi:hypothetical protein